MPIAGLLASYGFPDFNHSDPVKSPPKPPGPATHWTYPGVLLGIRLSLPLMPGVVAFGGAFGALAAQKNFDLFHALLMSGFVYAGMAQLVVLEAWPDHLTLAVAAALILVTVTINLRFVLTSAALRPWLEQMPAGKVYPMLVGVTDSNWLIAMRYRADGGRDAGVLLGSVIVSWVFWMAATVMGHALGALIADPQRFGLDLVMPVFFVAMLIPLWRGPRHAIAWVVAGVVALVVQQTVGGWWFIVAGAVSGSVAGGFIDDRS